ncbi:carbohydrate ABC transporter substrate-binding protein (CUT1 family) [Scopulibacillus darangshiensis]|uniref:Carbohydrate ABC transporter substrate-binding protein (CUT1 family) n=1 Tax=Scopulibacillus darangshiensis TaxID=442528 RepID=A0A4R2P406_9BACL|nr:ABC transporter substrate-binding protein [Scopulibacillus darangshiensis]TCP29453.1 carbohydrate ABC transporter substrate-binding protein (CUT1 family) [Scopulibacillus darangshiensis]
MKKFFSLSLIMILILSMLAGCSTVESAGKANDDNTLVIWTFFGDVKLMAKKFEEKYPNDHVIVKVFPGDQYKTKLQTALQAGGDDAPDIFDLERSYMGKFINSDFPVNLTKIGGEELVKGYVPYVQELGRDKDGDLMAVADTSSPGGFWCKKANAKKWLGTDDPEKISKMVESWDKIIKLGEKINKKSHGKVHLISHFGDVYNVEAYHLQPFVKDKTLQIDDGWKKAYKIQKEIFQNDVGAHLEFMSAGWNNALNEGNVILTAMPAWASFMIDNEDGKAENKYAVAKTPKGLYFGGTYRAINRASDKKKLAYKFLKFVTSKEWQQFNLEKTGNAPALKSVYKDNFDSYTSPLTGHLKILKQYYDLVEDVPAQKAGKYSEDLLGTWRIVAGQGIKDDKDFNDVVTQFKKKVRILYPEIKVK